MRRINPTKAALSVGIVVDLWHALWVTLVATGFAKPVMNFILRLHFLQFDYGIAPFSLSIAATLVGLTFAVGAIFGLIFALVWNWLGAQAAASGGAKPQPAE